VFHKVSPVLPWPLCPLLRSFFEKTKWISLEFDMWGLNTISSEAILILFSVIPTQCQDVPTYRWDGCSISWTNLSRSSQTIALYNSHIVDRVMFKSNLYHFYNQWLILEISSTQSKSAIYSNRTVVLFLNRREEVTSCKELHDFYFSPNIVRVAKSRRAGWAEYVGRMGEMSF
jgi:hypothetical protein